MGRHTRGYGWGLVLVLVGLVLVLDTFDVLPVGRIIWTLIALMLIWWGLQLIKRGKRGGSASFDTFADRVVTTSSDNISHSSVFSDVRLKIDSAEFARGSANTVFGSLLIDLKSVARIIPPGRLELQSVFGDIVVRVPDGIAYSIDGSCTFGSIIAPDGTRLHGKEYKSPDFDAASDRLVIRASQVFGNIEII